jgi:hypothetical protein
MSDINELEGGDGTTLGALRESDDELDSALDTPISNPHKRNREMDVTIAEQLFEHEWQKTDIRSVLSNHHSQEGWSVKSNYLNGVLDDAENDDGEVN